MDKKGKGAGTALVVIMSLFAVIFLTGAGVISYKQGWFSSPQSVVQEQQTTKQVVEQSKEGNIASIGVYVRDLSNNNINTKLAVTTYCVDDDGTFVIDGTTSSTTAEITGKTSIGKTITCYAFSSTYQTLEPKTVKVDETYEHIVVDAYTLATSAKVNIYNDQLNTGTGGSVNLTGVGAGGSGSWNKLLIKNNNTDKIFPLGGVYFDTVTSSNISNIDMTGSVALKGVEKATSAKFVKNTEGTNVGGRKELWNYAFEIDADPSEAGNQALLLEEGDYLESGSVNVLGDGDGCASELVSMYTFTKGYYRAQKSDEVKYGYENDALSSSAISSDFTVDTWYCTS